MLVTVALVLGVVGVGGPSSTAWAADDPLARARQLYNERRFEAAVLAAEEARSPERGDSVDLIAARAFLERFRESASQTDLTRARERLRRLNPERLNHGERVEYLVGLGEHLFLAGAAGAAANVFDSVLTSPHALTLAARERVLDWWASAVDSRCPATHRAGSPSDLRTYSRADARRAGAEPGQRRGRRTGSRPPPVDWAIIRPHGMPRSPAGCARR